MKLLLKGGTVVSAAGSKIADLLIEDEKIVRVGQDLTDAEATVVPMEGKLLFLASSTRIRISTSTSATPRPPTTSTPARAAPARRHDDGRRLRLPEQGRDAAIRTRPLAQKRPTAARAAITAST